ncbi:MAG: hypothetical protein HKN87_14690 [Saprospiraceae bacterium]|nr:hypothetical protein [Saprospiraceae bacterium]
MKDLLLVFTILVATFSLGHGQRYITAMGIRMGTDMGITLQQRILSHTTIEGIFTTSAVTNISTGTVLLQLHNPLIRKSLNFYIGGGFHNRWIHVDEKSQLALRGITGIAGAELTIGRINLAWDFKPTYHLNVAENEYETETAISLRYVLVKKSNRRKKKEGIFSNEKRTKNKRNRLRERKRKQRRKNSKSRETKQRTS